MITCHRLDLTLASAEDLELLDDEERGRAQRFHFQRHRTRYIAAHAQLRRLLGARLGIDPARLPLTTTARGKPIIVSGATDNSGSAALLPTLAFYLTHCEAVGYLAIAPCEVGIDVELLRPLTELDPLIESSCSPAEIRAVQAMPADVRVGAFLTVWTRKEAVLKAWGTGIGAVPLNLLHVGIEKGSIAAAEPVGTVPCPALSLTTLRFADEIISVAAPSESPLKIRMLPERV